MSVDDPYKTTFGQEKDPLLEGRALLVTGVAFVVLIGWNVLLSTLYPHSGRRSVRATPAPVAAKATEATETPQAAPSRSTTKPGAATNQGAATKPGADAEQGVVAKQEEIVPQDPLVDDQERTSVVKTDLYEATLTNRGARLRSLKLKKYDQELPSKGHPSRPVEAVSRRMIGEDLLPLAIDVPGDKELTAELNGALFTVDKQQAEASGDGRAAVTFRYVSEAGLEAVKTISFGGDSYLIDLDVSVRRLTESGYEPVEGFLTIGPGLSNPPKDLLKSAGSYSSYDYFGQAVYHISGRTYRKRKEKVKKDLALDPGVDWVGLEQRYFAAVFLPEKPFSHVIFSPRHEKDAKGKELTELYVKVPIQAKMELFVGPKELKTLRATHAALPDLIAFGRWLGTLAKPLLYALNKIESYTGNYGVAIILLTLAIRLSLFPLTIKSFRSMKRMQKLQPKVKAIRERFSRPLKDPAERRAQKMKMNEETMALYKKEGVNPVGGCFPMLLQMPFLFAFYRILTVAIELRHAPFLFWIQDLSHKDPLYITPIIMTAAQFFSQKLTPVSSPDPNQQRMMQFMPLFFLFIFLKVPSGLVIYWLTSNLFQIGQQLFLNRTEPAAATPTPVKKGRSR